MSIALICILVTAGLVLAVAFCGFMANGGVQFFSWLDARSDRRERASTILVLIDE